MEKRPRADDFIRKIKNPDLFVPDPDKDFGMFQQMDIAFEGIHDKLDELRRNHGRLGYSAQNLMSDLSKSYIEAAQFDDEEAMAWAEKGMTELTEGFSEASLNDQLAETGNRFSRTIWQEQLEAGLFGKVWPVITGKNDQIPSLISWKDFRGNIQAYLYAYLDVVSEPAKALTNELSKPEMTSSVEFMILERYLAIADSITLRLSLERHIPGYVINNAYGPWAAYTNKLRTAYGTIAHVRREYNLRRSIQRMNRQLLLDIEEMFLKTLLKLKEPV